jgi:hypothetical protein
MGVRIPVLALSIKMDELDNSTIYAYLQARSILPGGFNSLGSAVFSRPTLYVVASSQQHLTTLSTKARMGQEGTGPIN